jgi:pre-rRNA-processing protein TSR4
MSEDVDDEGDLVDVELGYESLEEDEEEGGFYTNVLLGYLEQPPHKHAARRDYFPSKAGGRPAWLSPENLPSMSCQHCKSSMRFLMQLYSPLPAEAAQAEQAFHRSLFVFVCPDQQCFISKNSVQTYRCQLPLDNPFYAAEPPAEPESEANPATADTCPNDILPHPSSPLCVVCGAISTLTGASHAYCSEAHRDLDLKATGDAAATAETVARARDAVLFPTFMVETEEEYVEADFKVASHEKQMMATYDEEMGKLSAAEKSEDDKAFSAMFGGQGSKGSAAESGLTRENPDADQVFIDFQARMSYNPGQALRYIPYARRQRHLTADEAKPAPAPLWTSASRRVATKAVPACGSCGAARVFEFQILPQLLYFFEQAADIKSAGFSKDEFDFGTICVYTCGNNCGKDGKYVEDFAYVQPPNA